MSCKNYLCAEDYKCNTMFNTIRHCRENKEKRKREEKRNPNERKKFNMYIIIDIPQNFFSPL